MIHSPDGNAIVYCEGAFNTPNGKTAHGLVRFTQRYRVLCVVDSRYAGQDAGEVLDGRPKHIPVYATLAEAVNRSAEGDRKPTHLVIGIAPDGGRLNDQARSDVLQAVEFGLNVDSGLHDFLTEDPLIASRAKEQGVILRDVRKTPARDRLHFFSGIIEEVDCLKIALLGTDSAVGKRTTAWLLVQAFEKMGIGAEMIGTGQTACGVAQVGPKCMPVERHAFECVDRRQSVGSRLLGCPSDRDDVGHIGSELRHEQSWPDRANSRHGRPGLGSIGTDGRAP